MHSTAPLSGSYGIVNAVHFEISLFLSNQNWQISTAELHHADVPSLLHFAARYGFKSVSSLLLQCPGAERALHTANRHGQTPTEIAKTHGHTELHVLLKETLVTTSSLAICSFHPSYSICFEAVHIFQLIIHL